MSSFLSGLTLCKQVQGPGAFQNSEKELQTRQAGEFKISLA